MSDALRRHPAIDLIRGCIVTSLLDNAEEFVQVDLLVGRMIGVRPSLATIFDGGAHLAALLSGVLALRVVRHVLALVCVCCSATGIQTVLLYHECTSCMQISMASGQIGVAVEVA